MISRRVSDHCFLIQQGQTDRSGEQFSLTLWTNPSHAPRPAIPLLRACPRGNLSGAPAAAGKAIHRCVVQNGKTRKETSRRAWILLIYYWVNKASLWSHHFYKVQKNKTKQQNTTKQIYCLDTYTWLVKLCLKKGKRMRTTTFWLHSTLSSMHGFIW